LKAPTAETIKELEEYVAALDKKQTAANIGRSGVK
jgi:hypothetical protein